MDRLPYEILDLIIASIPDSGLYWDADVYSDDTHQLGLCRLVSRRFLHLANKYYFDRESAYLCWQRHGDNFKASRLLHLLSSTHSTITPLITSVYIESNAQLVGVDYLYAQHVVYVLARLPKLNNLTISGADWSRITPQSIALLGSSTMLRSVTWRRTQFQSLDNMIESIFQITPQIDRLDIEEVSCYDETTLPSTQLRYDVRMSHAQRLRLYVDSYMLGPVLLVLRALKASFREVQISCEFAKVREMAAVTGLFSRCGGRLESVEVSFLDTQNGISEVIGPHPISFAYNDRLDELLLRFHGWEEIRERYNEDEAPEAVICPPDALSIVTTIRSTCLRYLTLRFDIGEVNEAKVIPVGFDKLEMVLVQTFGVHKMPKLVIDLALHDESLDLMEEQEGRFATLLQEQLPSLHEQGKLWFCLERYLES